MKLSDQRLDEILVLLRQQGEMSAATREEWVSMATELKSLRLRTSSASRTAVGQRSDAGHH